MRSNAGRARRISSIAIAAAASPDRADRVHDPAGGQAEARGEARLAGRTAAEPAAGREQFRPRCAVNGPVDSAPA
jgi:hypothetical protein